jgi:hypothetical protein
MRRGYNRLAVARTQKERLADLEGRHEELVAAVRQLATYASVLALSVRDRHAVPAADLDDAVAGIQELSARLLSSPGTGSVADPE